MIVSRSRPLMLTLLLTAGLSVWIPGASTSLVAQKSAHSGSSAQIEANDAQVARSPQPAASVDALPSPRYFSADAVASAEPTAAVRLVPSAVAAQTYSADAATYRATHAIDAARPLPADRLLAAQSQTPQQVRPAIVAQQVAAVAAARGLAPERVGALIAYATDYPMLGLFGEPTVNLRLLNLALDDLDAR